MSENSRPSRNSKLPARFQPSDDESDAPKAVQTILQPADARANARVSRTAVGRVADAGAPPAGSSCGSPAQPRLPALTTPAASLGGQQQNGGSSSDDDDGSDYDRSKEDAHFWSEVNDQQGSGRDSEEEEEDDSEGGRGSEEEKEEKEEKEEEKEEEEEEEEEDDFSWDQPALSSQQPSGKRKSRAASSQQTPAKGKSRATHEEGDSEPAPAAKGNPSTSRVAKKSAIQTLKTVVDKALGCAYEKWPTSLLQKVCTRRRIKGMSACKSKSKLSDALAGLDDRMHRTSPFFDDLKAMVQGVSAAIDLTPGIPIKTIPPGLVLVVRRLLEQNTPRQPNKKIQWDREEYHHSDIFAVIDTEDARSTAGGGGGGKANTTAARKTRHCFIRLACLIGSDVHRDAFGESRHSASRKELDTKATGSSRGIWQRLAEGFRDENVKVANIFEHSELSECDPNIIAQPNMSEAKLCEMWREVKGKWNPCWSNWKGESGNHQPWEMFNGNSKDVLAMGELIAKFPHLQEVCSNFLPEDAQREFTGTRNADGSTGGVKSEISDAERRAETKRKGRELFEATKRGQRKKLNDERTKSMEATTKKTIEGVVQSLGPLLGSSSPAGSIWRERTEEAESTAALLDLNNKINEEYKLFSGELAELVKAREEASDGAGGAKSVRETFCKSMVEQVEQRMLKAAGMKV